MPNKIVKWSENEEKFLLDNYQEMSLVELGYHLGKTSQQVGYYIRKTGLKKIKGIVRRLSEEEVSQRLLAVGSELLESYKASHNVIKLKCPFCGNGFLTSPEKVWTQHTKSCGCVAIGRRKGGKYVSGDFWGRLVRGATRNGRSINIEVDIQYIEQLLVEQDFKCKLSGIELIIGYMDLTLVTASVDRIDSSKGYEEGNCQWVHKDINFMKQELNEEVFLNYCSIITKHNENFINSPYQ